MADCFNLNDINNGLLDLMSLLGQISVVCNEYVSEPSDENGEKLVKIIEESEKKMLKVKRSVAIMANHIDGQDDIVNVEETKNGLVIE